MEPPGVFHRLVLVMLSPSNMNRLPDVAILNSATPPKIAKRAYPGGKLSLWGSRDANLDVLQASHLTGPTMDSCYSHNIATIFANPINPYESYGPWPRVQEPTLGRLHFNLFGLSFGASFFTSFRSLGS